MLYRPIYIFTEPAELHVLSGKTFCCNAGCDSVQNILKDLALLIWHLPTLVSELSGDYNYKKHVSREETMNMITGKYQELKASGSKVMTASDYFYNVPYSDIVTGMTLSNKSFSLIDESDTFLSDSSSRTC